MRRWTPDLEADQEDDIDTRSQAALAEATSSEIAWLTERLHAERGEEWIKSQPNLAQRLEEAFEQRLENRLERIAEALEDDDAEKKIKRGGYASMASRMTRRIQNQESERE